MATKLLMTTEALTDLLQLDCANLKVKEVKTSDEYNNTIELVLDGNSEYEGKQITLSYINPGPSKELDEQCINQRFVINRLHSISVIE